jgi:hypothetical protein
MSITRKQAITILDRAANYADEAWPDLCDDIGLYDESGALGVTDEELREANA